MAIDPPWRVLVVDDDVDVCKQLKDFLEDETVEPDNSALAVEYQTDFEAALAVLETERFDLLILDVRVNDGGGADEEAGIRTLKEVQGRRFLPVIYNTNIPEHVRDLESPLIRVVEKSGGTAPLLAATREVFQDQLPLINRLLLAHFEDVQREYMWGFVGKHWDALGADEDRAGLAHLLARRLALSLSQDGVDKLVERLGGTGVATPEGSVEPMRYYVMPPVEKTFLAGDIFCDTAGESHEYWMLLTPSCDLANEPIKADHLLLARCVALETQLEYTSWKDALPDPGKEAINDLARLLSNSRLKGQADRVFFFPGALAMPHLLVDLQQLKTISYEDLQALARVASLDSPFSEAIIARFTRYFGRIGLPNLNVDGVIERLRGAAATET